MLYEVLYGMKSASLDEARQKLESLLGVTPEARESIHLGGDYYKFEGKSGETLTLVTNADPIDGEPVFGDSGGWPIAASLEDARPESAFLAKLNAATDLLYVLESKTNE